MKRLMILTLCSAIALGASFNTLAAEGAGGRRAALRDQVKEKLALTEDQVSQIKSEFATQKEGIRDISSRLIAAKTALRAAIQKKDVTETDIRAAAGKVAAVEADAAVLRWKLHAKIIPILSSEQREKLKLIEAHVDDLIDKMMEKAGDRLNLQ